MPTTYTETPDNFNEIGTFVEKEINGIKKIFYLAQRVIFYDAYSFQRHSHLPDKEIKVLMNYYKIHGTVVFITKCILMELASDRHSLAEEYIAFIKKMAEAEIKVVIFNEEYTYDILLECFSTNERINEYLSWAVRMVKSPVSTITETLKNDEKLTAEVLEGKNLRQSDIYRRFFATVRENKEHADNLGEEHKQSYFPMTNYFPGSILKLIIVFREVFIMYIASKERYTIMEYNRCGDSGLMLPKVSLGLWHNFGDTANFENMRQLCFTAFDNGITQFDLANNYGPEPGSAEINFGRILKEDLGKYRDELIITTKAGYEMWDGPYGNWGSRKYLLASLDQSLKRMGLEYVDIFYHHRMDPETPLEETMGALASAVQSGKALYVGLSNYDGKTLSQATSILQEMHCPFVINQNRYSIFDRTVEKNGLKKTTGILKKGLITFSPLAQGQLTDRYLNGIPEDSRIRTDGRFLKESNLTPERVLADPGAE